MAHRSAQVQPQRALEIRSDRPEDRKRQRRVGAVAIQACVPHLPHGGRIITIGGNPAVRTAFAGASVYSTTKGAVAALIRGVAIDLAPRGITVNNVQPGPTA